MPASRNSENVEYVFLRGVQVDKKEIDELEHFFGGKLVWPETIEGAVIYYLCDRALAKHRARVGDPNRLGKVELSTEPLSWFVPVELLPPSHGGLKVIRGKSRKNPVGLVAWFKIPRIFSVIKPY